MNTRKNTRHTCEFCYKRQSSVVELRVHKRRNHLSQGSLCPFCSTILPEKTLTKHVLACQKQVSEANESYLFSSKGIEEDSVLEIHPRLSKPPDETIEIDWSSLLARVGKATHDATEDESEALEVVEETEEADVWNLSDEENDDTTKDTTRPSENAVVELSSSDENCSMKNGSDKGDQQRKSILNETGTRCSVVLKKLKIQRDSSGAIDVNLINLLTSTSEEDEANEKAFQTTQRTKSVNKCTKTRKRSAVNKLVDSGNSDIEAEKQSNGMCQSRKKRIAKRRRELYSPSETHANLKRTKANDEVGYANKVSSVIENGNSEEFSASRIVGKNAIDLDDSGEHPSELDKMISWCESDNLSDTRVNQRKTKIDDKVRDAHKISSTSSKGKSNSDDVSNCGTVEENTVDSDDSGDHLFEFDEAMPRIQESQTSKKQDDFGGTKSLRTQRSHKLKALVKMKKVVESESEDRISDTASIVSDSSLDIDESDSDSSSGTDNSDDEDEEELDARSRLCASNSVISDDSDAESDVSNAEYHRLSIESLKALSERETKDVIHFKPLKLAAPFTNLFLCYVVDPAGSNTAPPLPSVTSLPIVEPSSGDIDSLLSITTVCEICGLISTKGTSKHKQAVHSAVDLMRCCYCAIALPAALYPLHTMVLCGNRPGGRQTERQRCNLCSPSRELRSPFHLLWHAIHKHSEEINEKAKRFMCPECEGTFLDYFFDCHSSLCHYASSLNKSLSSLSCYAISAADAIKIVHASNLQTSTPCTKQKPNQNNDHSGTSPSENKVSPAQPNHMTIGSQDIKKKVLKSNNQSNLLSFVSNSHLLASNPRQEIVKDSENVSLFINKPSSMEKNGSMMIVSPEECTMLEEESNLIDITNDADKESSEKKVKRNFLHNFSGLFLYNIFEPVSPPLSDAEPDDDDDMLSVLSAEDRNIDLKINSSLTGSEITNGIGLEKSNKNANPEMATTFSGEIHATERSADKIEEETMSNSDCNKESVVDSLKIKSIDGCSDEVGNVQCDYLSSKNIPIQNEVKSCDTQAIDKVSPDSGDTQTMEPKPDDVPSESTELSNEANKTAKADKNEDDDSKKCLDSHKEDVAKAGNNSSDDIVILDIQKVSVYGQYMCEFCAKHTNKLAVMTSHKRKHKDSIRCPLCLSSLPKALLYCHRRIFCTNLHGQVTWTLKCCLCDVPQPSPFHLLRHAIDDHPDHVTESRDAKSRPNEPERFRCQHCAAPVRPIFFDCHQEMCLRKLRYEMKARPSKKLSEVDNVELKSPALGESNKPGEKLPDSEEVKMVTPTSTVTEVIASSENECQSNPDITESETVDHIPVTNQESAKDPGIESRSVKDPCSVSAGGDNGNAETDNVRLSTVSEMCKESECVSTSLDKCIHENRSADNANVDRNMVSEYESYKRSSSPEYGIMNQRDEVVLEREAPIVMTDDCRIDDDACHVGVRSSTPTKTGPEGGIVASFSEADIPAVISAESISNQIALSELSSSLSGLPGGTQNTTSSLRTVKESEVESAREFQPDSTSLPTNCEAMDVDIDETVLEPTASDEALFEDISEVLEAVMREDGENQESIV